MGPQKATTNAHCNTHVAENKMGPIQPTAAGAVELHKRGATPRAASQFFSS